MHDRPILTSPLTLSHSITHFGGAPDDFTKPPQVRAPTTGPIFWCLNTHGKKSPPDPASSFIIKTFGPTIPAGNRTDEIYRVSTIIFYPSPCHWIIKDIIPNPLKCAIISNNMIVITGLPGECGIYCSRIYAADSFVLIDDYRQ